MIKFTHSDQLKLLKLLVLLKLMLCEKVHIYKLCGSQWAPMQQTTRRMKSLIFATMQKGSIMMHFMNKTIGIDLCFIFHFTCVLYHLCKYLFKHFSPNKFDHTNFDKLNVQTWHHISKPNQIFTQKFILRSMCNALKSSNQKRQI